MNKLTLILILLNILLISFFAFLFVNKNCAFCQRELSLKRIFTFKSKCSTCEEENKEQNHDKTEQILKQTCLHCSSTRQLLEIHEIKKLCVEECWKDWEELLSKHYQEQIILNLAQKEAQKEGKHE